MTHGRRRTKGPDPRQQVLFPRRRCSRHPIDTARHPFEHPPTCKVPETAEVVDGDLIGPDQTVLAGGEPSDVGDDFVDVHDPVQGIRVPNRNVSSHERRRDPMALRPTPPLA